MLRLRVYRLALPLTILGMRVWALLTIGGGTLVSLQYWQDRTPAALALPLAAFSGWLLSKVVELVMYVFPGRALTHTLSWLTQGDYYRVTREVCAAPLVVPRVDRFLVRPSRKRGPAGRAGRGTGTGGDTPPAQRPPRRPVPGPDPHTGG